MDPRSKTVDGYFSNPFSFFWITEFNSWLFVPTNYALTLYHRVTKQKFSIRYLKVNKHLKRDLKYQMIDSTEKGTSVDEPSKACQTSSPSQVIQIPSTGEPHSDQVQILLQALSLTSQLASLDTESYKTNYPEIQKELDDIQKRWKLEETPIPSLVSSIHRLQSSLFHIDSEHDFHSQTVLENFTLKKKVQDIDEDRFTLKRAVKKLVKKNQILEEKLSRNQHESRKLFSSMKAFIRQKHVEQLDAKELVEKTKLSLHEHMLKQGGNVSEPDIFGNRSRSYTAESGLSYPSDLDTLSYLDTNTQDGSIVAQSPCHEIDEVSVQSISSTPSFVSIRSNATPTLRIGQKGMNLPAQPFTIQFKKGEQMGLKLVQVASDYTLVNLKPKDHTHESQCPALSLQESNWDECSPTQTNETTTNFNEMATPVRRTPKQKKKSVILDFFSDVGDFATPKTLKSKVEHIAVEQSDSTATELCKYLFLVQDSFVDDDDTSYDRRSLIGSRLIAINDTSLLIGSWDINLVTDLLKALEEDNATNANIVLTFRRDILGSEQLKQCWNNEYCSDFSVVESNGTSEIDTFKASSPNKNFNDKHKQSSFSKLFKKR